MTSTLRQQVFELLSAPFTLARGQPQSFPPTELCDGVLMWTTPSAHHEKYLSVRESRIVACNLQVRKTPAPIPSSWREALPAFLASITNAELDRVNLDHPVLRIDDRRFPDRFDGFVVVHPSLAEYRVTTVDSSVPPSPNTWLAFPCHRCEFADEMDANWARLQLNHLHYSDFHRSPGAAARGRIIDENSAAAREPRQPLRPSGQQALVEIELDKGRRAVELENSRGRVLFFANGTAKLLPDGPKQAVVGRDDVRHLVQSFLVEDVFPVEPVAPDRLERQLLSTGFVAGARDVVNGVEPVEIEERIPKTVVLRLAVRAEGTDLKIEFETVGPRLSEAPLDTVAAIVNAAYFHGLTNHYWRDRVGEIVLGAKGSSEVRRYLYPYPKPSAASARKSPGPKPK